MRTPIRFAVALALTGALVTACSGAATPTPAPSPSPAASIAASPEASPSPAAAAPSPAPSPSPSPNACAPANLATLAAGKLTIGTDNPAYPPYFQPPASGNATKPWQLGDPTNGQGFEAAFAYALAGQLGLHEGPGDLDRGAVQQLLCARQEAVRLLPCPGLVHA